MIASKLPDIHEENELKALLCKYEDFIYIDSRNVWNVIEGYRTFESNRESSS